MRIVNARRIAQTFFLVLFFWFCWVTTLGTRWWQLGGWPVNWLLQLDPLVGLATLLAARTLYAGLLWGLFTVVSTLVLGRFFCGWVCPFGTMQQAVGFLSHRGRKFSEKIGANRYRGAQKIKYAVLVFLLAAAAADLIPHLLRLSLGRPVGFLVAAAAAGALVFLIVRAGVIETRAGISIGFLLAAGLLAAAYFPSADSWIHAASVQTGLLDPIPLAHRGINLTLMPLFRGELPGAAGESRSYAGAWLIGLLFWAGLFLCLWIPRFYCRMVCPLGALFGLLGRKALWRIGKDKVECRSCLRCETYCEGACRPSSAVRSAECVLCMNCMDRCRTGTIGYRTAPSAAGEIGSVGLSRRAFSVALISGVAAVPMLRLGGLTASNWPAGRVRPPGALDEGRFLRRCIKCGQCMRICPTNVIQPALFEAGIEGFWTPVLNFRIGSSGCQLNCVACGHVCPTAAIRGLSLDEKLGRGAFQDRGAVKIGTAFIDRGRCLPWAADRPCIVCQETCPVSPKAIRTEEVLRLDPESPSRQEPVKLQRPYVDPDRCIGCGICEHECPVQGRRAIYVTAENESREPEHALLAG